MKESLHIGKIIQQEMHRQGRTNKWLAEQINCQPSTICKIYKKQYMDTYQLLNISRALSVDFFRYFSDCLC